MIFKILNYSGKIAKFYLALVWNSQCNFASAVAPYVQLGWFDLQLCGNTLIDHQLSPSVYKQNIKNQVIRAV